MEPINDQKLLNVIIEPTTACNLKCPYCYKGNKKSETLSIELFKDIARQVVSYVEARELACEFILHGGEPTLLGAGFYKQAFDFVESLSCKTPITYSLQTNGTLLTDELLDILAKQNLYLGISLDSTYPEYHDRVRPHTNGSPTHATIVNGIKSAKNKGIDVGVLMSITEENANNAKEMFEFCRQIGVKLGLNPVAPDLHSKHKASRVSPETYLKICIEIFDLWFYQKEAPIRANPGFGVVETLLSRKQSSDSMGTNCQMHYVSFGPEGDIYPCNRFYGVKEYKFGNIKNGFEEAMNCEKRNYLLGRFSYAIEKCRNCPISFYCNGGCMHHAVSYYGSIYSPDHLCSVYLGLVEHAIKRLEETI